MHYMTKQGKVILEVIGESCEHMTAEEILEASRKKLPNIAGGTVYRNLALFSEQGIIRKIEIINAPDRYDKNAVVPHEHLICDKCGGLRDLNLDGLREFISEKTGLHNFIYELNILRTCPKCRKKNQEQ